MCAANIDRDPIGTSRACQVKSPRLVEAIGAQSDDEVLPARKRELRCGDLDRFVAVQINRRGDVYGIAALHGIEDGRCRARVVFGREGSHRERGAAEQADRQRCRESFQFHVTVIIIRLYR